MTGRPCSGSRQSLDGPVVKAAQRALDTRNPAFALIWVQATDEPEIRTAFERTLAVRGLSPQAKQLADRFFFETLVRCTAPEKAHRSRVSSRPDEIWAPQFRRPTRPLRKAPWNQS